MTTCAKLSCLTLLALMFAVSAHANDANRGKELSTTCAACHGADGNSPASAFPTIAGQPRDYLYRALQDYKTGSRENAIMSGQVAALSKQDMRDLAAFYSEQQSGLYLKR